ncbi:MAG TPA: carboxypeptidase-like regulatory domain-containing protein [Pyrinomonadaceae bacterium]|jgi:hypothetical protein|nr:carboxypeptidase-like regulatory domain-containing protein [Pyrinomonadaceae bacterium]
MRLHRYFVLLLALALCVIGANAQDKGTGVLKGKIQVETGSASGVSVVVRQGDTEVARTMSDKNGEFTFSRLAPGIYALTLRKTGLSVGSIENLEVKAGKTRSLNRLVLSIDEGSITFLRGSVFDEIGRSVPNVRIELARILGDGTLKKLDARITNDTGSFVFRLTPDPAKYRVTAKADGHQPASKDVDIDSAAVYRIAISLPPK